MHLSPALLLLVVTFAGVSPTKAQTFSTPSLEGKVGVVDKALAALRKGDSKSYLRLSINFKRLRSACPKVIKRLGGKRVVKAELAKTRATTVKEVKACSKAIDWARAKEVSRNDGRKNVSQSGKCRKSTWMHTPADVTLEVNGKRWRVSLGKSMVVRGRRFLFGTPRCSLLR